MLSRRIVQLLVAVFLPTLVVLSICVAIGWSRAIAGVAGAALIGLSLMVGRKLRCRPWKLLLITAILSVLLALAAHLLSLQTVVVENQSGQTAWLRLSARDQGDPEEVYDLSGLGTGRTFRFSFEGPFVCHGVAVSGVLRDHTPLTDDTSADVFFQTRHHFTRIRVADHGVCHYSGE